ncbi:hypothetical protein B0H21DRAFT_842455 [Amylocystis lapponica]|nr:hypothetical protein B0H21DRAFT_842455 [Amylocystis lapponica]
MPGRLPPVATGPVVGKDEFGRDLRTDLPMDVESLSASHHGAGSQSPPAPATSLSPGPTAPEAEPPSQASPPVQHAPTIVPAVVPAAVANVGTSSAPPGAILQQGLETFDASTFDPSSPASWVALGNAWSVTHGYIPSQEELMQFTLSGGLMGPLPIASQFDAQQMDAAAASAPNLTSRTMVNSWSEKYARRISLEEEHRWAIYPIQANLRELYNLAAMWISKCVSHVPLSALRTKTWLPLELFTNVNLQIQPPAPAPETHPAVLAISVL